MVLDHMSANKIPGATVAITKGGRLVFSKAYGYQHVVLKDPMLTTTRTRIGSVSKLFTAAAVMKLHQITNNGFTVERRMYGPQGLFPAGEYGGAIRKSANANFPPPGSTRARQAETWYYQTQVKHLLSHSAGWPGSGDSEAAAKLFGVDQDKITPKQNHLYFIGTRVPKTPPGSKYDYSNRSVGVLDHVIELVSGKKYVDFVKEHILHSIGLTHVAAVGDPKNDRDSWGFVYTDGGSSYKSVTMPPGPGTGSAGGWRATAADMARFMAATDQLWNQSDILLPATLNLMETRPFPKTVPNRALGWGVIQKGSGKWLTHNGEIEGGSAFVGKGTPGYIASDGTDLTHVTVAICANIWSEKNHASLGAALARLTGKTTIPTSYDLF